MSSILDSPLLGIVLCIVMFEVGVWIQKRTRSPIANPLLIAILLVISALKLFHIPLESFNKGGNVISMFLAPATATLAVSIYGNLKILRQNLIPIIAGTAVGSATSMISVYGLCKLFGLEEKITVSLIPKSVTTPIAMELSNQAGGLVPITVVAVIITGILGAMVAPYLIKIFRVKDPVAAGVAIGTSSHAVGTSKAVELGEIEGAMSGIAIGVAGFMTVIFSLFIA